MSLSLQSEIGILRSPSSPLPRQHFQDDYEPVLVFCNTSISAQILDLHTIDYSYINNSGVVVTLAVAIG